MISADIERRIKEVARIADVVGDFYELKKAGVELTCPCPMHHGRHLNHFKVSEKKNMAYCFVCGWGGGPIDFLMAHERMSYPDALRWLGKKYLIEVDDEQKAERFSNVRKSKPVPIADIEPLPMLVLPTWMVTARLDTRNDTFCNWLRSLPWNEEQRARVEKTLREYAVGSTKDNRTIFWNIDEQGRVRTGKIMCYRSDGHRDKTRRTDWIHSALARAGKYFNPETHEKRTCLFGLHLVGLAKEIPTTVNIVESEKTAVICAIAHGNHNGIWLATGGMQFFKREMLQPLIDLDIDIVIYPDRDGKQKWVDKMAGIGYGKIHYNNMYVDAYWKEEDGEKADAADVILRLMGERGRAEHTAILERIIKEKPIISELITKLELEII